jgi:hypothetical protein
MHKAVPLTNVLKLVNYKYYEGSWKSMPDFSKLTPVKSGNLTTVTMAISGRITIISVLCIQVIFRLLPPENILFTSQPTMARVS